MISKTPFAKVLFDRFGVTAFKEHEFYFVYNEMLYPMHSVNRESIQFSEVRSGIRQGLSRGSGFSITEMKVVRSIFGRRYLFTIDRVKL